MSLTHGSVSTTTQPPSARCFLNQLDLFKARLPAKPYHTDELVTGLAIAKVQHAIKSRHIQPNGPTHKYWLVFDVDKHNATLDWSDIGAPAPNIVVTNPKNGHAHLLYGLEVSIRTAPDGRSHPLRYAAAIEAALREKLGADRGYTGLICKNPLHPSWRVTTFQHYLYDLNWLADYLDLSPYDNQRRLPDYGLGRNCNLFEYLAKWSYKAIRQGWPAFDQWFEACRTRAEWYNTRTFEQPLPGNEVTHTARSVARWTYQHFSEAGFSAWQAKQGAKGGKKSKGGGRPLGSFRIDNDLLTRVLELKSKGLSYRLIAAELDLSLSTVSKYVNWTK